MLKLTSVFFLLWFSFTHLSCANAYAQNDTSEEGVSSLLNLDDRSSVGGVHSAKERDLVDVQNDPYEECVSNLLNIGGRSNVGGGHSEREGDFVVASYRMKSPAEFDEAQIVSRRAIGTFLGVTVASLTESIKSRGKTVENGKADEVFKSTFNSITRTSVDMLLAGISLQEVREHDGKIYAIYTVSEANVKNVKEVSSIARKQEGLCEVVAIGMALLVSESKDSPHTVAMDEARKEAIKMVSGMVLVSSSSLRNDRDGIHQSIYGQTQGVIQRETLLSQEDVGGWHKVTCKFVVDATGLLKEYSAHFISLGSPKFYIDYDQRPAFKSTLGSILSSLNVPIASDKSNADYVLKITEEVAVLEHPISKIDVTTLDLTAELSDCRNGKVYWSSEVYSASDKTELGLAYQEKQCLKEIFDAPDFSESIHREMGDLVQTILTAGREITIKLSVDSNTDINPQDIFDTIRDMPGVISAEMTKESTILVHYPGRVTILDELIRSELNASLLSGYSFNLSRIGYGEIEYEINTQ